MTLKCLNAHKRSILIKTLQIFLIIFLMLKFNHVYGYQNPFSINDTGFYLKYQYSPCTIKFNNSQYSVGEISNYRDNITNEGKNPSDNFSLQLVFMHLEEDLFNVDIEFTLLSSHYVGHLYFSTNSFSFSNSTSFEYDFYTYFIIQELNFTKYAKIPIASYADEIFEIKNDKVYNEQPQEFVHLNYKIENFVIDASIPEYGSSTSLLSYSKEYNVLLFGKAIYDNFMILMNHAIPTMNLTAQPSFDLIETNLQFTKVEDPALDRSILTIILITLSVILPIGLAVLLLKHQRRINFKIQKKKTLQTLNKRK